MALSRVSEELLILSADIQRESMNDGTEIFQGSVPYLKWPQDRLLMGLLSISELQAWYASQDPREMIFLGQEPAFQRFIFWHYTLPVKGLRTLYKIKRILKSVFSFQGNGALI
jgi:hypothetical protein